MDPKKNKKPIGVVLLHQSGGYGFAFDIFVKKGYVREYKWIKERCYDSNCTIMKDWLKNNKGYTYLGSEDLDHIPDINASVANMIEDLIAEGFRLVIIPKRSVDELIKPWQE